MRLWRLLGVVLVALTATTVSPAWACGCGGYVPDAASPARVSGETALVRFDGSTEEIHLSMAVNGNSRTAAWIMPVPSAARVELGREGLFKELAYETRTRVEYRTTHKPSLRFPDLMSGGEDGSGGAPTAGGVQVRGQMVIGPFQVVRLGATDAAEITDWLTTHGYAARPGMAATLAPYVAEKWEIVAVRLAPKTSTAELSSGATPPLRLSFSSDEIVYPMRMSKGATTPQDVTVYVAAPYKVVPQASPDPQVDPRLMFAGKVSSLTELAEPASYLTAYTATYEQPERISSDFRFGRAPDDQPYQRVQVITRNEPFWANVAILAGAHVLLLVFAIGLALTLRKREQARAH